MTLSRCLASAAVLLVGADGARRSHKHRRMLDTGKHGTSGTKFISGVPIVNYHAAYGGRDASLVDLGAEEQDWLVILHPGTTDAQIKSLCDGAKKGCKMSGHPDKGGVPFLDMTGTEADLEALVTSAKGAVKLVEPDQPIAMIPELDVQPSSGASWGLDRVGSAGRGGNLGTGTHIYILDTGVRTTHQDFGGRGSPAVDYSSGSPVECNGDLSCAPDNQGHGTHCAGTAAGTIYGVAPQASVYGAKVLGDDGSGSFAAITGAIDWTASTSTRPAVASMSLGGTCPLGWCGLFGSVTTAVDAAVASGVTVVVAGGNSNSDACGFVPAFVPSAITVGSTDSLDARSYFSNYGSCTNIWAPGSAITSATHVDDSGSATFSGTSMACPHVAGGAALILEKNPEFTAELVLEKLFVKSAANYITDLQEGDVNNMLYVAADAPPPPGNVPPPPEPECPFYCLVCWLDACAGCC